MAMKRFRVAEDSMLPTLRPGEEFAATDSRMAMEGDLAALEHPDQIDFWLVKRVASVDRGQAWMLSDNSQNAVDSRTFGSVPVDALMPVVTQLDKDTFAEAAALLGDEDEAILSLLREHGLPDFWHREPGFRAIVLLILEQQVSLESGAAMYRRLVGMVGEVTPDALLSAGDRRLRAIGVTRQKSGYLLGLSDLLMSGDLDLSQLENLPAEEARDRLTAVKGIGAWTADAYLLSALRRPDMWPVGDRALQVGVAETLGLREVPSEEKLELLGEPWRPLRAVAARLIWHAYLEVRGRVEPPTPF